MRKKRKLRYCVTVGALSLMLIIFFLEWCLFQTYVKREVAWSPFLNGDANWYLSYSYVVFDSILKARMIPSFVLNEASGFMIYLVSSLLYLFFGCSRLAALSTIFIFYILWQGTMFYVMRYVTKSWFFAFAFLGLCLSVELPFNIDKVSHPILCMAEYQRDFVNFCFFGIFIAIVLLSDSFRKRKQSLVAGFCAGLVISFRYFMLFHMIGIYLAVILTFFAIYLLQRKHSDASAYKARVINGIGSFIAMGITCFYPIYLAKGAIYNHYIYTKIIGPKDMAWINLYQQGVRDMWQRIAYYPNMIIKGGLGTHFCKSILIMIGLILLFSVFVLFLSFLRKKTKLWHNSQKNSGALSLKQPNKTYSRLPFLVFVLACISVPLCLFIIYPVRSGNVGRLITAACVMFIFIFLQQILSRFYSLEQKPLTILKCLLAVSMLCLGMIRQMDSYANVSVSSINRDDYLEVAKLYDGIITFSKEHDLEQPAISVNFLENYVLGCCQGIVAYHYERSGKVFKKAEKLGSDLVHEVEKDNAISLLKESDIVLFCVKEESLENRAERYRDPLSNGLSQNLFSKSIKTINPILLDFVRTNFLLKGQYKIFNREIELYINKHLRFRPISIGSSSKMNDQYSAETILDVGGAVWHSKVNPDYPQWIEFEYKTPVVINEFSMQAQQGGPERTPSQFCFQGQDDNGKWIDLLVVENASFTKGAELRSWPIEKPGAFKRYRLYITKNTGAPDLITIARIIFEYAADK